MCVCVCTTDGATYLLHQGELGKEYWRGERCLFFLHKLGLGKIQLAMNPRFLLALGLVQQNGENCPNLYKMGVVVTSWLIGRTCSLSLGPLAAVRRDCRIYDECGFF